MSRQRVLRPESYEVCGHDLRPQSSEARRSEKIGGGLQIERVADADCRCDRNMSRGGVTQETKEYVCTETEPRSDNRDTRTRAADGLNRAKDIGVDFGAEGLCREQRRRRSSPHVEADNPEAALSAGCKRSHVGFVTAAGQTVQQQQDGGGVGRGGLQPIERERAAVWGDYDFALVGDMGRFPEHRCIYRVQVAVEEEQGGSV